MSALERYQAEVRELCLGPEPGASLLAALGGEPSRWLRYRTMVRRRLRAVLHHAYPLLLGAVGEDALERAFEGFLAAGAGSSPHLRDFPGEWLAWLSAEQVAGLPAAAIELARYEWARLSVGYLPDGPEPADAAPLAMGRPVLLRHALLTLDLSHRATTVSEEEPLLPASGRTLLCVYRDPESLEARTLELTPGGHRLLELLRAGNRPLGAAIRESAALEGAEVDAGHLAATSAWLADLAERGVLLGATREPPTPARTPP
ncbi:MAG: putative DNA-binding domain-containing protein [Deltaproteobacteria bacterium]|nr:putative DNA-binding domain-containing protein [Deltaproteobacteria bacterium]